MVDLEACILGLGESEAKRTEIGPTVRSLDAGIVFVAQGHLSVGKSVVPSLASPDDRYSACAPMGLPHRVAEADTTSLMFIRSVSYLNTMFLVYRLFSFI